MFFESLSGFKTGNIFEKIFLFPGKSDSDSLAEKEFSAYNQIQRTFGINDGIQKGKRNANG